MLQVSNWEKSGIYTEYGFLYRVRLGVKQRKGQAVTWTNIDQDGCRHMASLGHNGHELTSVCNRE